MPDHDVEGVAKTFRGRMNTINKPRRDAAPPGTSTPLPLHRLPSRRLLFVVLVGVVTGLVAFSLIQDILVYATATLAPSQKIWRLDVDVEQSVYTWFSASLILVNAAMLALIALEEGERPGGMHRRWMTLAAIFVLLSADEAIAFHEWLSQRLHEAYQTGGLFYFAWVIPGMAFCLALAVAYGPFLYRLPRRTRFWAVVAAVTFLSGALGLEMLGGRLAEQQGVDVLGYRLMATAEEALEGLGMVMFLYALLLFRDRV